MMFFSFDDLFLNSTYRFITLPFLARDPKAIEIVQVILESILLRREKNMRDVDGNKIVELPSKEVCWPWRGCAY
jgi:DNA repair protein RAD5